MNDFNLLLQQPYRVNSLPGALTKPICSQWCLHYIAAILRPAPRHDGGVSPSPHFTHSLHHVLFQLSPWTAGV